MADVTIQNPATTAWVATNTGIITIEGWGAGGGGGGGTSTTQGAGGGGGGAYAKTTGISVTKDVSYTIQIGAGGPGDNADDVDSGTATFFKNAAGTTVMSADFGVGGQSGANGGAYGAGGLVANCTYSGTGSTAAAGGNGGSGYAGAGGGGGGGEAGGTGGTGDVGDTGASGGGGAGGSGVNSPGGDGGAGGALHGDGQPGSADGGGGGGGGHYTGGKESGGKGGDGRIDITYTSISSTYTKTYTADGIIKTIGTKTYTVDGVIKEIKVFGAANWYNSSWTHRVKITVLASKVDADLTDFPVYVDLSNLPAGFHTYVNQTDARDIRVTTSNGTSEVPREVVFYDSATDTGELHFKANVDGDTDTDFYIYYGNASASDYAHTDTYGTHNVWSSDYKAVYHMNEDPSGAAPQIIDSTSGHTHGTSAGTMLTEDLVTTPRGKGIDFEGTDDLINMGDVEIVTGNQLTLSAWIKFTSTPTAGNIVVGKNKDGESIAYTLQLFEPATGILFGANNDYTNSTYTFTSGTWYYVTGTYDSSNGRMYVNGVQQGSDNPITGSIPNTTANLKIGAQDYATYQRYFHGVIDEVRILSTARGATWLTTEYNNQLSPSTFYDIGPQEVRGITVDAILISVPVKTYTADGIIFATSTKTYAADAWMFDTTKGYTYEDSDTLPTGATNYDTLFESADYTAVGTDDTSYVTQSGYYYKLFMFRDKNTNNTDGITPTWIGRVTLAPTSATLYLQIYNRTSQTWTTLDSDSTTSSIESDITLTGTQSTSLSDYYDSSYWVICRVYQGAAA